MSAATVMPDIQKNISLARMTTWKTGGVAEQLYIPQSVDEFVRVLQSTPSDVPITTLGLGSNSLISDDGVRGLVVAFQKSLLNKIDLHEDGVTAQAGVACTQLARFCARNNLVGAEFLAGIPGTVGGALAMNAGCYGSETWDIVKEVTVLDRAGHKRVRNKCHYDIAYRSVEPTDNEWFVSANISLAQGDGKVSLKKIKQLLETRNASQPTHLPNCGSVFRNPEGDYAARLIEACGLKGRQIGGAQISEKHANFIVNLGEASSSDILQLIDLAQASVLQQFNITLHREVKLVGEWDYG